MKKIKLWMKQNKFILITIFILTLIVGYSFYEYYDQYFSYTKTYYEVENTCRDEKNKSMELCAYFANPGQGVGYQEALERYLKTNDPKEKYKSLDAITLTSNIIERQFFTVLQFFSPFIIGLAVVGSLHSDFSSGIFYQYLMRTNYKKYFNRLVKKVFKIALIIPVTMMVVFLISMVVTRFNFDVSIESKGSAVYSAYKYENFILYGSIILLAQYMLSAMYGMIGLLTCFKNKSKVVAMIMSYITNLALIIFINIGFYAVFLNKILGIKEMNDYFSLTGYYFFNQDMNVCLVILIPLVLLFTVIIYCYQKYGRKESVAYAYEKQMG